MTSFYTYFEIRYDSKYSQFIDTQRVLKYISSLDELVLVDKIQYKNRPDLPWGVVTLVKANERGNYSYDKGEYFEKINLIEMILKDDPNSFDHYLGIGKRIAKNLNWELMDCDNDTILIKNEKGAA